MTLGTGYDCLEQGDLAFQMSAEEDRRIANSTSTTIKSSPSLEVSRGLDPSDGANVAGGSSYSPNMPLLPSSAGLAGVLGAQQPGILDKIGKSRKYLKKKHGRAWPPVLRQGQIAYGYTAPTEVEMSSNMNAGWNSAAQPGAAPGINVGFTEKSLGPSTWTEAMLYSPSPLTDHLGALASGFGAVQEKVAVRDMKAHLKALKASPGSSIKFDSALESAWKRYTKAFQEKEPTLRAVPGAPYHAFISPNAWSRLRVRGRAASTAPKSTSRPVSAPADAVSVSVAEVQSLLRSLGHSPQGISDGKTGPTTRSKYKKSASKLGVNGAIVGATGKTTVLVSAASLQAMTRAAQRTAPVPSAPPMPPELVSEPTMAPLPPPMPLEPPPVPGMPAPAKAGMGAAMPLMLAAGAAGLMWMATR